MGGRELPGGCVQGPGVRRAKLDAAWAITEKERVPKTALRAGPNVDNPKYREHSNPGAASEDAMERILAAIRPADAKPEGWLDSILTPPLVVDARFLHTDGLLRRLQQSEWEVAAAPSL